MFGRNPNEKTVGVDDFVLVEDFFNPDNFVFNLRERHEADIIYVGTLNLSDP